jgi:hypothetical protein
MSSNEDWVKGDVWSGMVVTIKVGDFMVCIFLVFTDGTIFRFRAEAEESFLSSRVVWSCVSADTGTVAI